jgi:ribonuclease BN (tRNA processing enzyme)
MELTVLGSGTSIPSLRRGAPGSLLRVGRDLVVIDCGPGTLNRLLKAGVRHDEVTHILCTHTHLDHIGELAHWMFLSNISTMERTRPLTLCGSAGVMRMLAGLREMMGHWLDASSYTRTLVTMDEARASSVGFDGWSLAAFPVRHIDSSLAFRITESGGATLACTGDTDTTDDLIDLARGADLLLIESSTPDEGKIPGHLTPSEAGDVARRARAGRVVLTHFYPPCDEADMLSQLRRTWDGPALLAEDGLSVRP